MIAQELEVSLHMAFVEARQKRHEFITVEHLLLALLDNPSAAEALRACGGNIEQLRRDLNKFIGEHTPRIEGEDEIDTQPTLGFQRVIQRAILHVQSSGKKEVNGANVLVAIFGEKDSHAVYYLQKQGITRLDVVNFISHGVSKVQQNTPRAEPGYCMEMDEGRAFIVGAPLPTQHEATEIQFGLKHHPDVKFRLAMYPNGDKLDESLLVRAKKADAEMSATFMQGVTTLRNGPRTVNALPGEEIVEGVREGFVRTQSMRWETLGKIRDPLYPMINLEGKTGYKGYKHTDSSLSDAQLLKLWDRIVNSIRLRTTSPARHSEAPPPRTPLGALALTGRACPETGWWQCADEGAPVLGGSRQFIRQNEPMPEVVLQGEPSLWQRVKGETPQFRRATVWQLSAYPDDAAATHATAPDTARSNAPQPPADKS